MSKDLKICIMIDRLASGSAPKTVGQEVRGLRSLGYDAEALLIKSGYSPTYAFHLSGVPIRSISDMFPPLGRLDTRFPGFSFFSLHHLTSAAVAPFLFKQHEWDMVISIGGYTCFTAQALKRTRGIPYLAFIATEPFTYILSKVYADKPLGRVLPILMPFASFLQEYILRDSSAVITYSPTYNHLIREYSSKPIETVLPGCFPLERLPERRENFILTFDRWDVGNMPHFFLDVLPRLSRKVDLVVAGHWYPESIKESFVREVQKRNLSDRVRILGPFNENDIFDFCSRALVHVHPNLDAFGMQTLEAAACGCPVVIPRGSGAAMLFEEGVHGSFPIEGDRDSYVNSIDKIISDPDKAMKMGREAWEVAKRHTWKDHVQKLAEIIEKYS